MYKLFKVKYYAKGSDMIINGIKVSYLMTLSVAEVTDMRRLTTGIRSEKYVGRRFRRCANVLECTYTNLDSIAYYTPSLYIAYSS